jgi:ABC-type transporter lipoprotein component MlaA
MSQIKAIKIMDEKPRPIMELYKKYIKRFGNIGINSFETNLRKLYSSGDIILNMLPDKGRIKYHYSKK